MSLAGWYGLAPASISLSRVSASAIIWLGGIVLGITYLLLPAYMFFPLVVLSCIFGVGIVKPEFTFYLLILIMIEELTQLFVQFKTTPGYIYTVRFLPYTIPLLATVLGLAVARATGKKDVKTTPVDIILWLIVAYQFVSILWVPNRIMGIFVFINVALNFLLFIAFINIITSEDILRRAVRLLILTGIINATGIILSQWISVSHEIMLSREWGFAVEFTAYKNRPSGFGGPNHSAGFTSMAILMALGSMFWESRKKMKFLYLISIIYMYIALVLTESRGGVFGFYGAFVFFVCVNSYFKGKRIRSICTLIVTGLFLTLVVNPALFERMLIGFGHKGKLYFSEKEYYLGKATDDGRRGSVVGIDIRKVWWMNALREMLDNPLKLILGLGVGGFLYYARGSPEVNSIYFAFFYDMGLFGIVVFLLLASIIGSHIYLYLKTAEKTYTRCMLPAATAAIVAVVGIQGLIEYDLSAFGSKIIWFLLAFSMALLNILKAESQEVKANAEM